MTVSNKGILLALALLAPDRVDAFAIPSSGRANPRASLHSDIACRHPALVSPGDSCSSLATRCNISQADLVQSNPYKDFCSHISSYEVICCSKDIQPRSSTVESGYQNNNKSTNRKKNPKDIQKDNEHGKLSQDENDDQAANEDNDGNDNQTDDQSASDDGTTSGQGDDTEDSNTDSNTSDTDDNDTKDDDAKDNSKLDGDKSDDDKLDGDDKSDDDKDDDSNERQHLILPGPRTGNWTKLKCDDPAMDEYMDPEQRWSRLGATAAFKDAMDQFKNQDRANNKTLLQSVFHTFGETTRDCSSIGDPGCNAVADCNNGFEKNGTGPAAMLIHNSFTNMHNMFFTTYNALYQAKVDASFGLDSFIDTFAPIKAPKDDSKWVEFFLEIITMGATAGLGKIIKGAFETLPKLKDAGKSDAAKDVAGALLGGAIDKLKDFNTNKKFDSWDLTQQHDLKATFGEVFKGWANVTSAALSHLFMSDDESINRLGGLMNGGKMIGGGKSGSVDIASQQNQFTGMMFSVAAPLAWRLSSNQVFVVDTGAKCDAKDIKDIHLNQPDFDKLKACIDDKLYYLAMVPDTSTERCPARSGGGMACSKNGDCLPFKCPKNGFVKPPGADALDGSREEFGKITASTIITGSVRTFKANGSKNGGAKPVDYTKTDSILGIADPASFPIAGMFRLPVCPPATAWKSWEEKPRNADNFPC